MGRCPNHKTSKKKGYSHKTARRAKFLSKGDDVIYDQLQVGGPKPLPLNEDLPGMGQFYCLHCDRYFSTSAIRDEHFKTKRHKKRLHSHDFRKTHVCVEFEQQALQESNLPVLFISRNWLRAMKMMEGEAPHSQLDAELAAGMGKPDNGPSLRISDAYMSF